MGLLVIFRVADLDNVKHMAFILIHRKYKYYFKISKRLGNYFLARYLHNNIKLI